MEQLSAALTAVTKAPFTGQLLSKDFKQHIKAIEYLQEVFFWNLFYENLIFLKGACCTTGAHHCESGLAPQMVKLTILRHQSLSTHQIARISAGPVHSNGCNGRDAQRH